MTNNDIEKRLWAADQLWANSNLKPSEFSTPATGRALLGHILPRGRPGLRELPPYRVRIAKLAAAHAALKGQVTVKEMGEK